MVMLCLGALCGVAIGRARGGGLAGLGGLRFHAPLLLALAALAQAGFGVVTPSYRSVAIAFAYVVVGVWLAVNACLQRGGVRLGCVVLCGGWLLNLIAIIPNGGMPVSADALEHVGAQRTMSVTQGHFYKHVAADRDTQMSRLGDVIPLPFAATVVSIGDIVMLAGIALVVGSGMTGEGLRTGTEPVSSAEIRADR